MRGGACEPGRGGGSQAAFWVWGGGGAARSSPPGFTPMKQMKQVGLGSGSEALGCPQAQLGCGPWRVGGCPWEPVTRCWGFKKCSCQWSEWAEGTIRPQTVGALGAPGSSGEAPGAQPGRGSHVPVTAAQRVGPAGVEGAGCGRPAAPQQSRNSGLCHLGSEGPQISFAPRSSSREKQSDRVLLACDTMSSFFRKRSPVHH